MAKKILSFDEWRRKQPRGAIMKPSTFRSIKSRAKREQDLSEERASKVAGEAYQNAARAKYREYVKRKKKSR